MNVLFAVSEAVPLAKSGGLADVAGALPKALVGRGVDARVILPKYEAIPAAYLELFQFVASFNVSFGWRNQYCGIWQGEVDGVVYYLIDNEYYFKRGGLYGYDDDPERFVFLAAAVMEAARHMDWAPDIVHCHDWQTALIPYLLRMRYAQDPVWNGVRSVLTIHNLKYQGKMPLEQLKELLGSDAEGLECDGAGNCLKGGLVYADKITTVSETYAEEIQTEWYGEGLDSLLRYRSGDLLGIVNGIDQELFNPMDDSALHTPYRSSLSRKRKNKLALQQELGLPESEQTPMIGIVSRLVENKGFDLVIHVLEEILQENVQLVVLGAGEYRYEEAFNRAAFYHPKQVKVWLGYNDRLARRIYAGSDMFLMPSQFEPCGLSQLIALRYGSVPIVRLTGGLKDTVKAYNEAAKEGNGFTFLTYNAHDMLDAVRRALSYYRKEEEWKRIVMIGSQEDYSWNKSAKAYIGIYDGLASHRKETETWPVIS
ncbi:glycogen synthase GlgA [Paenibacillus protaetiae]|uniref:Glycogen synthase n=1 Tax=Paenibacillus protaetiae TaxID=2509456 RepID=A0A4P6F779_9BACL|nr:glycogen synthase GlgA [Paenibacillus protaetiae]QAY66278.1 glycogen synthase GlgA [Paenibacillus protaetiae]